MISDSGIYKIINEINGNFYIGSAFNIQKRWARHDNDTVFRSIREACKVTGLHHSKVRAYCECSDNLIWRYG